MVLHQLGMTHDKQCDVNTSKTDTATSSSDIFYNKIKLTPAEKVKVSKRKHLPKGASICDRYSIPNRAAGA